MDFEFFASQTSDASSASVPWSGNLNPVWVSGTFGRAALLLQSSPDSGTTWQTFLSLTSPDHFNIELPELNPAVLLRAVLQNASSETIVSARIGTTTP